MKKKFFFAAISFIIVATSCSNDSIGSLDLNSSSGNITTDQIKEEAEDFTIQKGIQTETTSDVGGGENIGYINSGDYAEYDINAEYTGTYSIKFRTATNNEGGKINVFLNDKKQGSIDINSTNKGWQNWSTSKELNLELEKGENKLKLEFEGGSGFLFNLNWFELNYKATLTSNVESYFKKIQAEDFKSKSGIAIGTCADDDGGSMIYGLDPGDWAEYTLDLPQEGEYKLKARVASNKITCKINIIVNGINKGQINVDGTKSSSWQDWNTTQATDISLNADDNRIKLQVAGTGSGNKVSINWFTIENSTTIVTPDDPQDPEEPATPSTDIYMGTSNSLWQGIGRIGMSSDGNAHDTDDFSATAASLALFASKGLQDKLVLYTFSDHIWHNGESSDWQQENMRESALTGKKEFCFDNSNFIEAYAETEKAYNAWRDEINKSTAENPLFIVACGPMQVIGEGLNRSNSAKHKYVHIISHSTWNENHQHDNSWTWDKMKKSFPNVIYHDIKDQNGSDDYKGLHCKKNKFDWVKTSSARNNSKYEKGSEAWDWMYSRFEAYSGSKTVFDISDTGMVIYLLTGKGENSACEPSDFKELMENPF